MATWPPATAQRERRPRQQRPRPATLVSGAVALPQGGSLSERLDAVEAMVLRETLMHHRWNKTRVAKELGLSRVGLRAKMQRFGLEN